MKTERWYRRFTRHGLPRLTLQTLLIYLVITLLAQILVLTIATPDTYRQLELIYGLAMLLMTLVLIAWLLTRHAEVATQHARLFEVEHQQRMHAEALAQLATRLNAQNELNAVLQITCEETAHALNAPAASLYLYDAALDALVFSGGHGLPHFFDHDATLMPRAIFDAFNTRPDRLIIASDVQAYPDLPDADLYARCDLRTIAGASLLGLAISAQIMNKLGGLISVDSRPGEGAAFTVWLRPVAEEKAS